MADLKNDCWGRLLLLSPCYSAVVSTRRRPCSVLPPRPPDILSGFIDVTYDATTDLLDANGAAFTLDNDGVGPAEAISGGTFDLSAIVDDTGNATGGSFSIGGTVAALGFNSGTLLTGTLTAFGFPNAGGDPLEFIFSVTGGDAAGLYGASAGVILTDAGFPVGGDFTANFINQGFGAADAFAVPVPAALWLFGSALLGIFGVGLRRRRQA